MPCCVAPNVAMAVRHSPRTKQANLAADRWSNVEQSTTTSKSPSLRTFSEFSPWGYGTEYSAALRMAALLVRRISWVPMNGPIVCTAMHPVATVETNSVEVSCQEDEIPLSYECLDPSAKPSPNNDQANALIPYVRVIAHFCIINKQIYDTKVSSIKLSFRGVDR